MRSHITNMSAEKKTEEKLAATTTTKVSSSLNNGGSGSYSVYGLRENPKKTCRFADSSEDTLMLVSDKFCRECGKGFPSWKALFGHMKCHSDQKERVSNNSLLEDQDSWTNANATTQKLVMDSQSDNETTAPNRRRRSKRRTRYMNTATTSSISFANPSSSVSEVEQEQEEVAMSLMMLSRDVSPWSGFNSVADSSDNNSAYFEAPSSVRRTNLVTKIEGKNGSEIAAKMFKPSEFGNSVSATNLNSKGKSSELLAAGSPENGFGMNNTRVSINGVIFKNEKSKKSKLDSVSALEDSELILSKSATKYTSINKTKFLESELKSNALKNWVNKPSEAEFSKTNSHKRGKFECTTCNKIFHSYQALGGHRASHKKIKGCFASRNESSENSIEFETELSPDPTTESKLVKDIDNEHVVEEHELVGTGFDNEEITDTVTESKKNKVHECPICLKVFPSGQALGGHKRSHLVSGSERSRNFQSQTVPIQEPVPEIRDFLDLNLPAATEEESNNSHADSYTPWWVVEGRNHKQQNNMVGLMSN